MKLYAKWFYGFYPEALPIITFSTLGARDTLLKKAKGSDRIVFIAVNSDLVKENERGRILGMAEIGNVRVKSEEVIPNMEVLPDYSFDSKGQYKWPESIVMTKAWRFKNAPLWKDVMLSNWQRNISNAMSNAVLLSDEEQAAVLSLSAYEVDIPETPKLREIRETKKILSNEFPQEWGFIVGRLAKSILKTVHSANGEITVSAGKIKNTNMSEGSLQILLRKIIEKQNFRCAITHREFDENDRWLKASPDRIDSNGHYVEGNIQITTWAANRAKGNVADEDVEPLFEALQFNKDT